MKKEELVLLVKELFELGTKVEAEKKLAEVDTLVKAIADKLEVGQKVKVGNFIEVAKVHVDAKTARNPKTGEAIAVPEKIVTKVKATKSLNKAE
jgi:integration host factor subunit beta